MANCPCGSGKSYGDCCGSYLDGEAIAPTAEALMRSRYTAYAKGHVDYLIATHHPDQRATDERVQLRQTIKSTDWLGLTVVNTRKGSAKDKQGVVEFVALYRPKTRSSMPLAITDILKASATSAKPTSVPESSQLHERSRFVREGDRWLYVDGDQLPPLSPKRNDLCWCRSGKKFKHCHGK